MLEHICGIVYLFVIYLLMLDQKHLHRTFRAVFSYVHNVIM